MKDEEGAVVNKRRPPGAKYSMQGRSKLGIALKDYAFLARALPRNQPRRI